MRRLCGVMMCAVLLLASTTFCFAERGEWRGGIRERIHHARARIDRGIENGSLNHHEARRLRGELHEILGRIDRMRSDGDFSPEERERIHHALNRLERDITREKRDDDRRGDHHRDRDRRYDHRRY